jgi:DNA processing protein
MNKDNFAAFKLSITDDIGYIRFFNLIQAFGSAQDVFLAQINDLINVEGIGEKTAKAIINMGKSELPYQEIEKAKAHKIEIVLYNDDKYPPSLRDCADKPLVLYIKGSLTAQDDESISIVGSRHMTSYGKALTDDFAGYFARMGITIVSGLARGVDTQSHIAALENNARTIAVLGNGLLVNYPPENAALQAKIAKNGALISEYLLEMAPNKNTFPRRNRIISGLSKAVLVTEAALKSGALISARYAAEYGRDVFAVPGNIYSRMSQGANFLIQNGAYPVLGPQDMLKHLSFTGFKNLPSPQQKQKLKLNPIEQKVLSIIESSQTGITLDMIVYKMNSDIANIAPIILTLELNDLIESLPGQAFMIKR